MSVYEVNTRSDSLRLIATGAAIKHLHASSTLHGVQVLAASAMNGAGIGHLRFDGTLLRYKAPGSTTYGSGTTSTSNGTYLVFDGDDANKYLRVTIYADYTQPGEARLILQDVYNNALAQDNVTAGEATAGDVSAVELTLHNYNGTQVQNVKVWITDDASHIEISDDGITWVAPTSEGHGDQLTFASIDAGAEVAIHVRRTIAAAEQYDPSILAAIQYTWEGA